MSQHRPRHVSGRRRMPGLTNWRPPARRLKRQPQQHTQRQTATASNATTPPRLDDDRKGPIKREGIFAPNKATTRQARHLHPLSTLQGTKPSKHRHLRSGQCASRVPIAAKTRFCTDRSADTKCPPRPVRTRSYSHHGLIHLHHFQHRRGPLHQ